jgi:hypothetical protein
MSNLLKQLLYVQEWAVNAEWAVNEHIVKRMSGDDGRKDHTSRY